MKKEQKEIPINIWDDYYEDGYVPEGEQQNTYIYVEDSDMSLDSTKECLTILLEYIKNKLNFNSETEFELFFYDTALKYPKLVGTENEWMLFKRWEIRVKNLTHKFRLKLVKDLNEAKLHLNQIPFSIYSES